MAAAVTSSSSGLSHISSDIASFFEHAHRALCDMLLGMAAHIYLFASALTVKVDFGDNHMAQSTITTEPTLQPLGPCPAESPTQTGMKAAALMRKRICEFLGYVHSQFELLVHQKCYNPASVQIILRICETGHEFSEIKSKATVIPRSSGAGSILTTPMMGIRLTPPSQGICNRPGHGIDDGNEQGVLLLPIPIGSCEVAKAALFPSSSSMS